MHVPWYISGALQEACHMHAHFGCSASSWGHRGSTVGVLLGLRGGVGNSSSPLWKTPVAQSICRGQERPPNGQRPSSNQTP
eukprot:1672418-Pyramimonas_sp.AAC.1